MAYIKKRKTGVNAIEADKPFDKFYAIPDGKAVFEKPEGSSVIGTFQNSYFPIESTNFRWISARCKLKTKADESTNEYYVVTGLYGVRPDGKEELIGEHVSNSISTTETVEDIVFDVASSSSHPDLTYIDSTGATAGKIYLKLPSRWKNFKEIKIGVPWKEGWSYCRPMWFAGSNVGVKTAVWPALQVTVHYRTGMKTDFSDVRFIHPDGQTFLCYDRLNYRAGEWATFNILIDAIPGGSTNRTPILLFYGNSAATDKSSPSTVYKGWFWDFEDGVISDFAVLGGTLSVNTTSPISGGKSIQHTGNGADNKSNFFICSHNYGDPAYGVEYNFDFKIVSYGSNGNPYFFLCSPQFYDTGNFFWVDFAYDGGDGNTYVRLCYTASGSSSQITRTKFCAGKVPTGVKYNVNVLFSYDGVKNRIIVSIDNKEYITYYDGHFAGYINNYFGFGSNLTGVGLWDNIKIRYIFPHQPTPVYYNPHFFDNFDDNSISSDWVLSRSGTNANVVETGGELRVTNTATGNRAALRTAKRLKPPYLVRVYAKRGENVEFITHWDGSWSDALSPNNGIWWYYAQWVSPRKWVVQQMRNTGISASYSVNKELDTAYHRYDFYVYENYTRVTVDRVTLLTIPTPNTEGYFAVTGRETPVGVVASYNDFYIFDAVQLTYPNIFYLPDGTPGQEDMELIFPKPGSSAPDIPIRAYVDELGTGGMNTNVVLGKSQGKYRIGYDSIDKYIGFKFKPLAQGDKNCNIEFQDFIYEYEVLK